MKTYVYVDGFNLYYGSLKGTPYKWLNLLELMTQVIPTGYTFEKIKYFTAHVSGAEDPDSPKRQQAYMRALKTIPQVEAFYGNFLAKTIWRPVANLPVAGARINSPVAVTIPAGNHVVDGTQKEILTIGSYPVKGSKRPKKAKRPVKGSLKAEVHTMEEKGSDVNLAVHLLNDAWQGLFEAAVVISNDTDLVTPVDMVARERGLPVIVICTDRKRTVSGKLQAVASSVRHIRPNMLAKSQFPAQLAGGIQKPKEW